MSKNSNVHNHQLFTLPICIDRTPYCMLWPNKVELIFKWVRKKRKKKEIHQMD